MKRYFTLAALACLATVSLLAQQENNQASLPFHIFYGYGGGWDMLFSEKLSEKAASLGFPGLDPARLWRTGTRASIRYESFAVDVASERTTNTLLGPYGDTARTRFVWDKASFILSWVPLHFEGFAWTLGAGLGISKYLVQFYPTQMTSIDIAADARQASLVSSWDLSAESESTIKFTLLKLVDSSVFVAGLGAQFGWVLNDANWRLYDDISVSGMPKPIEGFLRFSLWIGLES